MVKGNSSAIRMGVAESFKGTLNPDDEAQKQSPAMLTPIMEAGAADQIIYLLSRGGLEDWTNAGSWLPEKVVHYQPISFGGYPSD